MAPTCLAPCQPMLMVISSVLLAPSSAPPLVILRPSGVLLPSSEQCSPTDLLGHCTLLWSSSSEALLPNIGSVFGADFAVRTPRCAVCTIPSDNHTMTPPPKKKNTLHVKKHQILILSYHPSNLHHHHHHNPYIRCIYVYCSATPQRDAAPAIMASRGQSQGPNDRPYSRSAGNPPPPSPQRLPPFHHSPALPPGFVG